MEKSNENNIKEIEEKLKAMVYDYSFFITPTKKGAIVGQKDADSHLTFNGEKESFHKTINPKKLEEKTVSERHSDEIYLKEMKQKFKDLDSKMNSGDLREIQSAFNQFLSFLKVLILVMVTLLVSLVDMEEIN